MLISEFELEKGEVRHVPSPGRCIYCNASGVKLTDEHVIPYALAANTLILDQSCCVPCQRLIQPYEQEVLKKQLGLFRAQIEAPTRNKRDRPKSARFRFVEVNDAAQPIRDLGHRDIPIAQAPLIFNLWSSPPPRLLREASRSIDERGRPWTYCERDIAERLCRSVAEEEGAGHVAMELGKVNRLHYLRALAKTAHAYAAAELGLDAFEPILPDLILNKSDDVVQFVGDSFVEGPFDLHPAHTLQMSIGEVPDGPAKGYLVARIQLYPLLNSPAHLIIVGRAIEDIGARFAYDVLPRIHAIGKLARQMETSDAARPIYRGSDHWGVARA